MFYILIENKMHVVLCDKADDGAIAVNDDVKNLYLYHYDADTNNIYKQEEIEYEINVQEIPYIEFLTDKSFKIDIGFYKDGVLLDNVQTDLMSFDVTDEGTGEIVDKVVPKLGINATVDGMIYITSATADIYFEPIEIDVTDTINNEYEPNLRVEDQVFIVEPSNNYKRLVSLQSDIEILKEEIMILKGGKDS